MSQSASTISSPLDGDPRHRVRIGRRNELDRDVATARKVAMEKTFSGTAV
jgi:hypothetical protein